MSGPRNTSRNIIVTCGTSQVEAAKVAYVLRKAREVRLPSWTAAREYLRNLQMTKSPAQWDTWWRNDPDACAYSQVFADVLAACWEQIGNLDDLIKNERNFFGAEISTLYKMFQESPPVFNPRRDRLVLLYSDTQIGAFCVSILWRLLIHEQAWKMRGEQIAIERVPELREEPTDAQAAERELVQAILDNHQEDGCNAFVITGGFKSVIPIITVYALVYGDDLYYLFEKSTQLLKLTLPAEVHSPNGLWLTLRRQLRRHKDQRWVRIGVRTGGPGTVPSEPDDPPLFNE